MYFFRKHDARADDPCAGIVIPNGQKAWSIVRSLVVGYIDDVPDGSCNDDTERSRAKGEVKSVDYKDDGGVLPPSFADDDPTNGHKLATVKLPFSAHVNLIAANPMVREKRAATPSLA